MIKHLSGVVETVEYEDKRFVMLYDNDEYEEYPIHWHDAVEIVIPLLEPFTVIVSGERFELGVNEILIIPPGELHTMPAQEGRRLFFQCDNSVISGVSTLDAVLPVFSKAVKITPESDKDLYIFSRKTILDIYSEYYSGQPLADVKIYLCLLNMLASVRESQLQSSADTPITGKGAEDESQRFALVTKYINQNYMYELPLEKLAQMAGYSKYHFSRIFKEHNGMSFIQYINGKRIKAAERLMADSTMPITEVAMQSGFASLTTFNRAFRKAKGCSPTEFRRMYKLPNDQ